MKKGRPGLTLVEFLFAVSIIAIAALGVASMFPAAYKTVAEGGQVTKATMLAREMMSMVRSYPFKSLIEEWGGGGYYLWPNFDTRTHWSVANTQCTPSPVPANFPGEQLTRYFNVKWRCDLSAAQGLANAYGTIGVACVDPATWTETSAWCNNNNKPYVVRVTVEVHWGAGGGQMVRLVGYVSKPNS